MTAEQAIKSLENIVEYWSCKPTEQQAAELAITALKEQQERERGCEHCTGDINTRPELIAASGVEVYIDGNGKLTLNDFYDAQLYFCPMCGRRLEENNG